jgi:hypothetical protein
MSGGGRSARRDARTGKPKATPESTSDVDQVAKAFDSSPGAARHNWVSLADLRDRLGGTREQQDRAIRAAVDSNRFTLDTHEGRHGPLTDRQIAATIKQRHGEKPFAYIARRED